MDRSFARLRLEQTMQMLEGFTPLRGRLVPPGGWLRAIREALGRTQRQQAARVGVALPTLHRAERNEAEGRITMAQLRKLADALDCDLVYALIPRTPLDEMLDKRAEDIAREEVARVAHTMRLEDQLPSAGFIESEVLARRQRLLDGKWSNLWR